MTDGPALFRAQPPGIHGIEPGRIPNHNLSVLHQVFEDQGQEPLVVALAPGLDRSKPGFLDDVLREFAIAARPSRRARSFAASSNCIPFGPE